MPSKISNSSFYQQYLNYVGGERHGPCAVVRTVPGMFYTYLVCTVRDVVPVRARPTYSELATALEP